ncbi:integrase, catalytic region, zinc finger, CCHC-type containing protein, partial [Tanacetum coccineum]
PWTQPLFVGQFCDGDLEVAFRSKTCYVRNLEGDDLLTSARESNLYMISISDMAASSLVCLMSEAISTKSWLWHRRLSYLNFGTINHLTKQDLVDGLPKFKYDKDHLCSVCEKEKSKKATLQPKLVPSTHFKLELIHMDLCGPMRVENINGEKYILVIVDDYSRDLDNLFGPMYKEYYEKRSPKVSINSVAQTTLNEDTPSLSSIIVEDNEAPSLVSSSEEQMPPISNDAAVESIQEEYADLDKNTLLTPFISPEIDEAKSSSTT